MVVKWFMVEWNLVMLISFPFMKVHISMFAAPRKFLIIFRSLLSTKQQTDKVNGCGGDVRGEDLHLCFRDSSVTLEAF